MMKNIANQNGRSMIEMLGVLAIVGVLSVGGIAGYSKAMQKYRTNKTIDQITQISNGIHTLYTTRNNYEGLGIGVLAKAKILPQELIEYGEETSYTSVPNNNLFAYLGSPAPNSTAYGQYTSLLNECNDRSVCSVPTTKQTLQGTNPFGGKILLSVDGDLKAFSLKYIGLPEDACIDVLTQDWGTTDLIAVGVDSSITSTQGCTGIKGTHVCNDQLPVSVEKAMDFCATQNDSKGVILKFR